MRLRFICSRTVQGKKTLNKSIELDEDELTIEENGETRNRYVERVATDAEADAIRAFVLSSFAGMELVASEDVDYPHVEVQVEFESGSAEAELTRIYPSGEVPPSVMDIQRLFFETQFE